MQGLAHQHKLRLQAAREGAQLAQILRRQAVRHIQAQAVNVIGLHPATDSLKLVLHNGGLP